MAQTEELQTHLGKDSKENLCQHLCVPWLPSTWLKACSEDNQCCWGGCYAPLVFIPSFLRKGKNKPKSISPEDTWHLCSSAVAEEERNPMTFLMAGFSSVFLTGLANYGSWAIYSVWQKFSSVLMLPVRQEAASVTKERSVIGLEGVRFSAAPVHQGGHWEGCWLWCALQQETLCAFLCGTNWPRWEEMRDMSKFLKFGTSIFLKSFGWRALTDWHLSDFLFPAGWLNKQFSLWEMPDGASYCRY